MIRSREIHLAPVHLYFHLFPSRRTRFSDSIQDPITPPRNPFLEILVSVPRTRFELVRRRESDWSFREVVESLVGTELLLELIVGEEGREGRGMGRFIRELGG